MISSVWSTVGPANPLVDLSPRNFLERVGTPFTPVLGELGGGCTWLRFVDSG